MSLLCVKSHLFKITFFVLKMLKIILFLQKDYCVTPKNSKYLDLVFKSEQAEAELCQAQTSIIKLPTVVNKS